MIKAIIFDFFGVLTTDYARLMEHNAATPKAAQAISDALRANDLAMISDVDLIRQLSVISGVPETTIKHELYDGVKLDNNLLFPSAVSIHCHL